MLPCITLLFFLSFLDRTNIGKRSSVEVGDVRTSDVRGSTVDVPLMEGNAKIQGMIEDLDMTGHDYNTALFIFFIPYIILEVPSNIIIKRIAPSTWLSIIMGLWGEFASRAPVCRPFVSRLCTLGADARLTT